MQKKSFLGGSFIDSFGNVHTKRLGNMMLNQTLTSIHSKHKWRNHHHHNLSLGVIQNSEVPPPGCTIDMMKTFKEHLSVFIISDRWKKTPSQNPNNWDFCFIQIPWASTTIKIMVDPKNRWWNTLRVEQWWLYFSTHCFNGGWNPRDLLGEVFFSYDMC